MTHTAPSAKDTLQTWLDYWTTVHVTAIDLGLERVLPVARALNVLSPEAIVFTAAGTNGKGSTTCTLSSILVVAGKKVGLYQSPHIFQFNERIRLNGIEVEDQVLVQAFTEVEQARQACELTLSFFEATTLAAFLIFKQQNCDAWVLEIGLGGRLDVVNIIDPDVAIITNIGLDHVDWLGDTIEKIAFEKAGIIRPNIPVVFSGDQALPQAIADKVQQSNAQFYQYKKDYFTEWDAHGWQLATASNTLNFPHGTLAYMNQAAAVMAVLASPLQITHQQLITGVQQAKLAGRFEQRTYKDKALVLDVAHNPHGIEFLHRQLAQYLSLHPEITEIHTVFSMLEDKDIEGVVGLLTNTVKQWYIAPLNVVRAAPIHRLQQALQGQSVITSESVQDSFQLALQNVKDNQLILVCGSFHTLEAVWECLENDE